MKKNKSEGFTILELLVVMAIAAMILSFVMVNISNSKKRARDSRRETDIKQIQNALSIYAVNRKLYPVCSSEVIIGGSADTCIGSILVAEGAFGGGQAPSDPLFSTNGVCGAANSYGYCYRSADGFTYELRYSLETDTILGKSAGWQPLIGP